MPSTAGSNSYTPFWGDVRDKIDTQNAWKPTQAQLPPPGGGLDKDAFLKLLITQLQNQDPMSPMDNTQFIAQMAQFTSLEQMQNMNQTTTDAQAFSMIGKMIDGRYVNTATSQYAYVTNQMVDSVVKQNGTTYLSVGGRLIQPGDVTKVYGGAAADSPGGGAADGMDALSSSVAVSQVLSLMGKHIQAISTDAGGNMTFIEGPVDYIKFDSNGAPILMVNGKQVYAPEVVSISGRNMIIGLEIGAELTGDSGTVTVTGVIDGVSIRDGKAFLNVGGESVPVSKINFISEALNYIGKKISFAAPSSDGSGEISGTVDSVTVRGGIPYLNVGADSVSYPDYAGIPQSAYANASATDNNNDAVPESPDTAE